jgi:glycosyltransferase involved in cell wall biosynthesis
VPFYPLIKGGAEYQSKIIATELQKKGYEIVYISYGHETEDCIYENDFKIHRLKVKGNISSKILMYKGFMSRAFNIIKDEKPDCIYQRILNSFTYRLSIFSKKNSIPLLIHIADNYSVEFEQGSKSLLKKKIFLSIIKNKPNIICQTRYQQSKILELGYRPKAVISNMHPVIIDELPKKDIKRIVWIGNARPVKQLEIFTDLANFFHDSAYSFHILGKLPENNYGAGLLKEISQTKNITYHGSQTNDFINSFLMQSALLVNTSVSEGFSNTFIQAWMCGTPVLALNSDPDDIMADNSIGVDCKGDYDKMKIALVDLLKDSAAHEAICLRSLQTARKLFSTEKITSKIESVLKAILTKTKAIEN